MGTQGFTQEESQVQRVRDPEPHPGAENAGNAEAETTGVGEALLHWKETGK